MTDIVQRLRKMADMTSTGNDLLDIGRAAAEIERLTAENGRLLATLRDMAEYCSGDGSPLGAIERLAAIRNTAERAVRHHEQKLTPMAELDPHAYVPSHAHQGDCAVCGHLQGAAIHSPSRRGSEQSVSKQEG